MSCGAELLSVDSCDGEVELVEEQGSPGEPQPDQDSDCIEYVQYLDVDDYEITMEEGQQVITIDDDSLQQVEYIEAQQVIMQCMFIK